MAEGESPGAGGESAEDGGTTPESRRRWLVKTLAMPAAICIVPLLFASTWGDASADGARRQQGVGSFFSSPLVVDGTVYIGSADANLYAID